MIVNKKASLQKLPRRLKIPLYILLESGLYNILGIRTVLRFLKYFSFDKKWYWYLENRENIPSHYYSLLVLNLLNPNTKLLDIGCGMGNFLKEAAKVTEPSNLTGIDKDSVTLLLAEKFLDNRQIRLLKADAEFPLPFKDSSFDIIHISDAFQYINGKEKILKECHRILKRKGILCVLQTLKSKSGNIRGIEIPDAKKLLKKCGFAKSAFFSNSNLLCVIANEKELDLSAGGDRESLLSSYSYTFFAARENIPDKLKIAPSLKKRFLNSQINYIQEPWLRAEFGHKYMEKFDEFLFISPHLDDAALSAATLIQELRRRKKNINIVTVFTKGDDKAKSPQSLEFLAACGYPEAGALYKAMQAEDRKAMEKMLVSYRHLGFIDAAFRLRPDSRSIYKNAREQFSGNISPEDLRLVDLLKSRLKEFVKRKRKTLLFAPLGVGGHADHIIVRKAVEKSGLPCLFWEDYPYNTYPGCLSQFFSKNKNYRFFFETVAKDSSKEKIIRLYKSQVKHLFPDGKIVNNTEKYYSVGRNPQ